MAINPSSTYAGQVSTSDPSGYPYGKAQNETVAGDGIGTPLEASWVSDVWGFLQALLDFGGVTPSGTPDKVGASQYLASLFKGDFTWEGVHTFTTSDVKLGDNVEVDYVTPVTRRTIVPLKPIYQFDSSSWIFSSSTLQWARGSGSPPPLVFVFGPDLLPPGGQILHVNAAVNTSVDVTLRLVKVSYDTSAPNSGTQGTALTDTFSPTGTTAHTLSVAPASVVANATGLWRVSVEPASGPGCALRWIEIEWLGPWRGNILTQLDRPA